MALKAKTKPTTKMVKRPTGYTRVAVSKTRREAAKKAIAFLRRQHETGTLRCPTGTHDSSGTGVAWQGHCAHTVACAYGRFASGWDAWQGWVTTAERYQRDGRQKDNPPRGALVFFVGGRYGHVAIANGRGKIWGNDAPVHGRIGLVPVGWITSHWGYELVGWVWPDEVAGW